MKALLYAAVEQAPSGEVVEPEVLTRYFAKFDEQFFHYCDKELTKINTFYSGNDKTYLLNKTTLILNFNIYRKISRSNSQIC